MARRRIDLNIDFLIYLFISVWGLNINFAALLTLSSYYFILYKFINVMSTYLELCTGSGMLGKNALYS